MTRLPPLRVTRALQFFLSSLDTPEAQDAAREAVVREALAIRALPPGPERAREVHRRVDAAIREFGAIRPQAVNATRCHRGCAHCCRIWVGITQDEALLLAECVRSGSAKPAMDRLEHQRHWQSPEAFAAHPLEETRCVFLGEDGSCAVYEDRPSACRALLVASDPEFCRTAKQASQVLAIINPRAELLVSAAQSADGPGCNLLAARLCEALEG